MFQYCYACHSVDPAETDLPGPNLAAIVGAPIAARSGFDYSPALKAFAARERMWSEALLDRYVAAPHEVVPGGSMAFHGMADALERADLIAYLKRSR